MNNQSSEAAVQEDREWIPDVVARHRHEVSALCHAILFSLSLLASFGLAYNFHGISTWFGGLYFPLLALALPVKLVVFWRARLYQGSWRYVGLRDLISIAVAAQVSSFVFIAAYFIIENLYQYMFGELYFDRNGRFAQSVFLIDWAATIGLVSAVRVAVRFYYERSQRGGGPRLLIVGAANAGETVLREILRMPGVGYDVVGFVDDDPSRQKHRIHGVEVMGTTAQIQEICEKHEVDEVLIAMPEAKPAEVRKVIALCEGHSLQFRTIPSVSALIEGKVQVSQIRPVDIADLLGRDPVTLDLDAIGQILSGKRIVVTGAGGSIGSEMCRQIIGFKPERLILIEQAENNLFEIHRELIASAPDDVEVLPIVADICDETRIDNIFERHRPEAVFHAAAHKHVPMMECNPGEAIKNNVVGTRTITLAAAKFGVAKMVMISTDKAVNPTSIMGCSKRVAEIFVQQFNARPGTKTHYVTVRFGNVLGSSGSVIPIFRQQIANGGPVTVTHPDMTRYFMTIPEASQLVLQAGTMGIGGEIYVLDMGEPVKIVDMARTMITLSGMRPDEDIEIVFTGTRPGEKLYEELLIDGENVTPTSHPKIGIWQHRKEDWEALLSNIEKLVSLADGGSSEEIRNQLGIIVPEYQPAEGGQLDEQAA